MDKYPQKENVKITLFYSENSENSETKQSPALFSQGRANFSGRNETSSFPPQQREFVSESVGGGGEIRTHVPLAGLTAFEAAPLCPLRYPSKKVSLGGIEPPSEAPEASVLSVELQGQN